MQALCRAARLDRVLHAQLAEDLLAVAADGVDAYREALRYLLARQAVVYKPQDLSLARGKYSLLGRGVEVDDGALGRVDYHPRIGDVARKRRVEAQSQPKGVACRLGDVEYAVQDVHIVSVGVAHAQPSRHVEVAAAASVLPLDEVEEAQLLKVLALQVVGVYAAEDLPLPDRADVLSAFGCGDGVRAQSQRAGIAPVVDVARIGKHVAKYGHCPLHVGIPLGKAAAAAEGIVVGPRIREVLSSELFVEPVGYVHRVCHCRKMVINDYCDAMRSVLSLQR